MATGVLISSFPYVGVPTLAATFGFFKAASPVQIQRIQIAAQTSPAGGNVTVQLVDQAGTAYSGATITLGAGVPYYDQSLAAPITLRGGQIVRGKITGVDGGVASDLVVNLIGATSQGSNAPTGCCGPNECQPPTAQALFFVGSVSQEQAAAAASALAAAASATQSSESAAAAASSASAAAGSATNAAGSAAAATASVTEAANWATNSNNAATAALNYANVAHSWATSAAVSSTSAAASAAEAQAGPKCAMLELTTGSVQSIADATPTAVIWNNAQFDDLAFWDSGNPTRITIPAGSGVQRIRLTAGIKWAASTAGERRLKIRSNPVGIYAANSFWASDDRPSDATGDATVSTGIIIVEEGMYFEVIAEQTSGGGLAIDTSPEADNHCNFFSIEVLKRA